MGGINQLSFLCFGAQGNSPAIQHQSTLFFFERKAVELIGWIELLFLRMVWWICWWLLFVGGLWAVAPPMAPPRRENKPISKFKSNKAIRSSEVDFLNESKERKQINEIDLVDFCCAMKESNATPHQRANARRQANNSTHLFSLREGEKWLCWRRNEQSKSFLSINSQIWWIDEEMNCLCEWELKKYYNSK